MNTTTNLGLLKPEYSDVADIKDINDNMDTLDGAIGALPEGKTVQEQINDINDEIGDTALPTTKQTLTGAIAEHETDLGTKLNKNQGSGNSGKVMVVDEDGEIVPTDFPSTPIDDTKGIGDTDFVWSADKVDKEVIRLDGIKANNDSVYATKTVSNDVIEIDDAVAEAVKQMNIAIAPVQDLHGYDHPWVGGSGKNLYDSSTDTDAKVINASGVETSSEYSAHSDYIKVSASTAYIFSGTDIHKSGNTTDVATSIVFYNSSKAFISRTDTLADGNHQFTTDENTAYVIINHGRSASYMQLESGSTATDYEPYSNICPISGWTGAKMYHTPNSFYNTSGTDPNGGTGTSVILRSKDSLTISTTSNSSYASTKQLLSSYNLVEGKKYILSATLSNASGNYTARATIRNSSNAVKASVYFSDVGETKYFEFTYNPTDHNYISFFCTMATSTTGSCTYSNIKLADSDGIEVTFPTSAGTVYGGTLTVNADGTGELYVPVTGISLGDLTWTYNSDYNRMSAPLPSNVKFYQYARSQPFVNDSYNVLTNREAISSVSNGSIYTSSNVSATGMVLWVHDYRFTDASEFTTEVADKKIVIELETPVTYTLTTDQVLHLLSGVNNVWSDCGDTTLTYFIDKYLTAEQAERERIHESITVPATVQTISDGADNVPMEMTVGIEPVQDLHGYEYPWVGGAGKNIFNASDVDDEHSYYVNRSNGQNTTPSTGVWRATGYVPVTAGEIYYIGKINSSGTTVGLAYYDSSKTYVSGVSEKDLTNSNNIITIPSDCSYMRFSIRIDEGYNTNWKNTVYFVKNSDTHEWTPYSNICPISGHTGVEVVRTGKNLCNTNALKLVYITNATTRWGLEFTKPGTYTVSGKMYTGNSVYCKKVNSDGTYGSAIHVSTGEEEVNATYTILNGEKVIVYNATSGNTQDVSKNMFVNGQLQVEMNSIATAYEPYNGTTYPITFPSSAGTVYGGTLKVNKDGTGVLTVTNKAFTLNAATEIENSSKAGSTGKYVNVGTVSDSATDTTRPLAIFETIKCVSNNERGLAYEGYINNSHYIIVFVPTNATLAEVNNALAGTKICYELATPVTYQLSAPIIRSLLGTNNLWADTGDVLELNYAADTKRYIDKKLSASQNLMELIITANREDSMTATRAYTTGNLLIVNGTLYKATTSIANGATITVGTNVTATTVAAEIAALS